jgi:hypothetical protein
MIGLKEKEKDTKPYIVYDTKSYTRLHNLLET